MKRKIAGWAWFIFVLGILTLAITYTIIGPCEFFNPNDNTHCQQGEIL